MHQIIELRTTGDESVFIMADKIIGYWRDSKMISTATYTSVKLMGGHEVQVQETPRDIERLLNP